MILFKTTAEVSNTSVGHVYIMPVTALEIKASYRRHEPLILPGAEDIEVAEADGFQAIRPGENLAVLLPRQLGDPVGREGPRGVLLVGREIVLLAIDRTARARENHLLDTRPDGVLQQVDRAQHVDSCIVSRVFHRSADVHLGRVVIYDMKTLSVKHLRDFGMLDADVIERGLRIQVFTPASGKVIDDRNLMPLPDIPIDNVGTNESRAAGYQDLHDALLCN
jgi:hypothetical protein